MTAPTAPPHSPAPATDGRTARAERTRAAIANAMLSLIEEGVLRPTAPMIAERAGVALRSVFQHFADMESLQAAVVERQAERVSLAITPIPASLPLPERIDRFVSERARIYEAITPVRRAAVLSEPFSPIIHERLQETRELAANEVAAVFASELRRRSPSARRETQEALVASTSWAAWEELRAHQSQSKKQAVNVLRRTVAALLT